MGNNFILVYRQLSLKKITYSRLSLLIVLLKPSHHCLLFSYTPKQNKKVFLITYSKLLLWYVQHRSCNQTTVRIQNNPITPKISYDTLSHTAFPLLMFSFNLVYYFLKYHLNGSIEYVTSWDRLFFFLLQITPLRFIQVDAYINHSLVFIYEGHFIIWMYCKLFTYWPIEKYLGSFHFWRWWIKQL